MAVDRLLPVAYQLASRRGDHPPLPEGAPCMYACNVHTSIVSTFARYFPAAGGFFSRVRLRGTQGGRPFNTAHLWTPAVVRGAFSGRPNSRELALFQGIAFRLAEPCRTMAIHNSNVFLFYSLCCCLCTTLPFYVALYFVAAMIQQQPRFKLFPLCQPRRVGDEGVRSAPAMGALDAHGQKQWYIAKNTQRTSHVSPLVSAIATDHTNKANSADPSLTAMLLSRPRIALSIRCIWLYSIRPLFLLSKHMALVRTSARPSRPPPSPLLSSLLRGAISALKRPALSLPLLSC